MSNKIYANEIVPTKGKDITIKGSIPDPKFKGSMELPLWESSKLYKKGSILIEGATIYQCIAEHTSNIFGDDWINNNLWRPLTLYPGSLIIDMSNNTPNGCILADGSAISRTFYETCFYKVGTTWGVGDGSTTFNILDGRGMFLRGAGTHGTLTKANGNYYDGGAVGDSDNDKMLGHKHQYSIYDIYQAGPWGYIAGSSWGIANPDTEIPKTDGTNGTPNTGDENNPVNYVVNYYFKVI